MRIHGHILTLLLLTGAVICYALALPAGGTVLIICGLILEVTFWRRLLSRK